MGTPIGNLVMNLLDQIDISCQLRRPNEPQLSPLRQEILKGQLEGLITGIFRTVIAKDIKN